MQPITITIDGSARVLKCNMRAMRVIHERTGCDMMAGENPLVPPSAERLSGVLFGLLAGGDKSLANGSAEAEAFHAAVVDHVEDTEPIGPILQVIEKSIARGFADRAAAEGDQPQSPLAQPTGTS